MKFSRAASSDRVVDDGDVQHRDLEQGLDEGVRVGLVPVAARAKVQTGRDVHDGGRCVLAVGCDDSQDGRRGRVGHVLDVGPRRVAVAEVVMAEGKPRDDLAVHFGEGERVVDELVLEVLQRLVLVARAVDTEPGADRVDEVGIGTDRGSRVAPVRVEGLDPHGDFSVDPRVVVRGRLSGLGRVPAWGVGGWPVCERISGPPVSMQCHHEHRNVPLSCSRIRCVSVESDSAQCQYRGSSRGVAAVRGKIRPLKARALSFCVGTWIRFRRQMS